jgi:hypothetical protein
MVLRQFKVGVRHRICFVLRTPKRTPTFNTGQYGELRRHLDSTQTSVGYGVPYAEPRSIVDVGRVLKAAVSELCPRALSCQFTAALSFYTSPSYVST